MIICILPSNILAKTFLSFQKLVGIIDEPYLHLELFEFAEDAS